MGERRIERVDELPLISHWFDRMQVAQIIDDLLPTAHGNRKGLSYGELSILFLMYTIHQRTHKLSSMEDWVLHHQHTLETTLNRSISLKEATDDRLGDLLDVLGSTADQTAELCQAFSSHLISAFELPTEVARYDTTSFNVYHAPASDQKTSGSLLQFGYSKDHRPDLLQFKQGLGILSSSGVPIFSETLTGNTADDPCYIPAWRQMATTIGHPNFLFVADCKAGAIETRATIAQEGGRYLFPLPMTGDIPDIIEQAIFDSELQSLELAWHTYSDGKCRLIAKGFEEVKCQESPSDSQFQWDERWLFSQSHTHGQQQRGSLEKRLEKTEAQLQKLQQKALDDPEELIKKVESTLKKHKTAKYFQWELKEEQTETKKYQGKGRPGPNTPFKIHITFLSRLHFTRNEGAIERAFVTAGWRIFVTNAPNETVSFEKAISYYRDQWEVEHGIQHWKKGNLPALPLYLKIEERIRGLMFLLTLALQALTLIEYVSSKELKNAGQKIAGLVPGNPKMKTARPSADRLMTVFHQLNLMVIDNGKRRQAFLVESLSELQLFILKLLRIPEAVYQLEAPS